MIFRVINSKLIEVLYVLGGTEYGFGKAHKCHWYTVAVQPLLK